mmetsp:Transcript_30806/g.82485  ORF Transcript_30806/g.82485 Transcript_30806/m.82485 type:complete len:123 (+) Transcript_30806:85-453(+)
MEHVVPDPSWQGASLPSMSRLCDKCPQTEGRAMDFELLAWANREGAVAPCLRRRFGKLRDAGSTPAMAQSTSREHTGQAHSKRETETTRASGLAIQRVCCPRAPMGLTIGRWERVERPGAMT